MKPAYRHGGKKIAFVYPESTHGVLTSCTADTQQPIRRFENQARLAERSCAKARSWVRRYWPPNRWLMVQTMEPRLPNPN